MKKANILILLVLIGAVVAILSVGIGSVYISPMETVKIIINGLFGTSFAVIDDEIVRTILWQIRVPRTLLAFVAGSGLAVSGVLMQSVLKNALASSYTLGVSSGAALGASIAILLKATFFGFLTLPIFGLSFGILTVFLSLGVAAKIDKTLQNNSIILTGMAFSLFANAVITIVISLAGDQLQRLVFWQMGSFAMKTPQYVITLFPIVLVGIIIAMASCREMDIMSLGDEQAMTTGVEVKKMKWLLLITAAVLTGAITAMVGIIGFLDLFTPHVARKLFGASHKYVLPASALLGGAFMVLSDLAARTILAPIELPVGAITSALGAPFFIYLYFSKRKNSI